MKRTCSGCRALDNYPVLSCGLGYKTKVGKLYAGIVIGIIPCEPCPKPITYNEFLKERRNLSNHSFEPTNDSSAKLKGSL